MSILHKPEAAVKISRKHGRYKHGGAGTQLHRVWKGMRRRCNYKAGTRYAYYGGRGIRICDEWNDFAAFRLWAMANGYEHGLSIERIDNNGNYEPSNCVWANQTIQNRNKRNNKVLTLFGQSKTMMEWSEDERCKVGYRTLRTRIRDGWTAEKAVLTNPIHNNFGNRQRKAMNE